MKTRMIWDEEVSDNNQLAKAISLKLSDIIKSSDNLP
jgi:hypothetical protein